VLDAVASAQAEALAADEALAAAVIQARESGHTWADIGQVLGVSRQAAFQRFGRPADPRTGVAMEITVPDAGDRVLRMLDELLNGQWEQAAANFDGRVAEKLGATGLAGAWAQVIGTVGQYERHSVPVVFQAGDYTVADVPLHFEAGELTLRTSYDGNAQVAGIFFKRPTTT